MNVPTRLGGVKRLVILREGKKEAALGGTRAAIGGAFGGCWEEQSISAGRGRSGLRLVALVAGGGHRGRVACQEGVS